MINPKEILIYYYADVNYKKFLKLINIFAFNYKEINNIIIKENYYYQWIRVKSIK